MDDDTTPLYYHKLGREEIRVEIEKIETNEKDFKLPKYFQENDEGVVVDILSSLHDEGWYSWNEDDEYTRNFIRYRHTLDYNTHLSHTCEAGSIQDGYNSYFFSKNIILSGKSTQDNPTINDFFTWFADNKNKEVLIGRLTFNSVFPFYGHIKVKIFQCHPFGDILMNELIMNIRFPRITEDDPKYCFAGDCLIEMENGALKYIQDILVGDKVKTKIRTNKNDISITSATVLAKTNQLFPHSIEMVYFKNSGLCLTPGHPVFDSGMNCYLFSLSFS
jgi:hypothetical protein